MRSARAAAAVALLSACTQSGAEDPARALCVAAYPDSEVVAAYATTVGDVRARQAGPGHLPAAGAWAGRGDSDDAAWCYVHVPGTGRVAGAATRDEQPVQFARGNLEPDPAGPRVP